MRTTIVRLRPGQTGVPRAASIAARRSARDGTVFFRAGVARAAHAPAAARGRRNARQPERGAIDARLSAKPALGRARSGGRAARGAATVRGWTARHNASGARAAAGASAARCAAAGPSAARRASAARSPAARSPAARSPAARSHASGARAASAAAIAKSIPAPPGREHARAAAAREGCKGNECNERESPRTRSVHAAPLRADWSRRAESVA